jgi:hypothetical protein
LHAASEDERHADALQSRAARLAELIKYRPQLAALDMARFAEQAMTSDRQRARWSSGPLLVEIVEERGDYHVRTSFGYRTLWTQPLPAKVLRGGAATVAMWSQRVVEAWLHGADAECAEATARAVEARTRAARSHAAATATDLSAPPELVAAEFELAAVGARINCEVVDVDTAPRRHHDDEAA